MVICTMTTKVAEITAGVTLKAVAHSTVENPVNTEGADLVEAETAGMDPETEVAEHVEVNLALSSWKRWSTAPRTPTRS